MHGRLTRYVTAGAALAALGAATLPATAATTPVGAAAWASTNVVHGAGCTSVSSVACTVHASSQVVDGPLAGERCQNATAAVTVPAGTTSAGFRCHVELHAEMALTGTPLAQQAAAAGAAVEIASGACAGLTVINARIEVHDSLMGDYVVYPALVVTPAGWVFRGTVAGFHEPGYTAVVLNAAATVLPACKRVTARRGETTVTFNGVFAGTYSFV